MQSHGNSVGEIGFPNNDGERTAPTASRNTTKRVGVLELSGTEA
jgi:hypothetical protein